MTYNTRKSFELQFRRWLIKDLPSKSLVNYLTIKDRNIYRLYFERLFIGNMNWDNYSKVWHIDHVVPLHLFNDNEIDLAWSRENLKPSFIKDNKFKGGSLYEALYEINIRLEANKDNQILQSLHNKVVNEIVVKDKIDYTGMYYVEQ